MRTITKEIVEKFKNYLLANPNKQKKLFSNWIEEAMESEILAFVKCAKTYYN